MQDSARQGQEFPVPGRRSILDDSKGHGNSNHGSGLFQFRSPGLELVTTSHKDAPSPGFVQRS